MFAESGAEFAVFLFEAREFQGVVYGEEKFIGGKRFFEEIEGAEARSFDGHFDVGLAGDEDDGGLQAGVLELFEEVHAGFAGHDDVRKDEVEMTGLEEFDGAIGVVTDGGFVPGKAKSTGERSEGVGVIVDEEEMGFA
jgi:hypothetical protein